MDSGKTENKINLGDYQEGNELRIFQQMAKKNQEEIVLQTVEENVSQSLGLSSRHLEYHLSGNHLCQDSNLSENSLRSSLPEIRQYAGDRARELLNSEITVKASMSMRECLQKQNNDLGDILVEPVFEDGRCSFRPDGGMIFVTHNGVDYPLICIEDKLQGTNDRRLAQGLSRQSTGNAIERAAKNIKMFEMLTRCYGAFPYVLFAAGCDFHNSETISQRLVAMNYGKRNHYFEITPETNNIPQAHLDDVLNSINIQNDRRGCMASIFVKAHKFNEMKHGCSNWTVSERIQICKKIIDLSFEEVLRLNNH